MEISGTQPIIPKPAVNTDIGEAANVISSDFTTFLQMLTVQARYQDPLEPLDSTEYASQLAQFSSVEQQVRTNDLLSAISAQANGDGLSQFANWIGLDAKTTATVKFQGSQIPLEVAPDVTADKAFLIVRNESGDEVARTQLSLPAKEYTWDGTDENGATLPLGNYNLSVESQKNDEVIAESPASAYSQIVEVRIENGRSVLVLDSGAKVSSQDVSALRTDG